MNYFLQHLEWWHWMVLAVLLAAAETVVPGAVAIWFAAAAAVIGLLLVVIPIPWQWQIIGFGVLGIVALLLFRSYRKRYPQADEQPNLNLKWGPPTRQAGPVGNAEDMCIDRNRGLTKGHVQDHVRSLSSD